MNADESFIKEVGIQYWKLNDNFKFKNSKFVKNNFPNEFVEMYLDCKSQECQKLTSKVTDEELHAYLNTV